VEREEEGRAGQSIVTLQITLLETTYNNDGTANVMLLVQDYNDTMISGATVRVSGFDASYSTGNDGIATISNVPSGSYNATVTKEGYSQDTAEFVIRFETKTEPAAPPKTEGKPNVQGSESIFVSFQDYTPWIILAAIVGVVLIWWIRRKKPQVDEQVLRAEPEKPQE
jgi:hypothetical protein